MAAYFLVFASVHSLLADPRFKRWAKERACGALDRWGRLAFNLLALIMLLPFVFILLYLPDEVIYIAPWPAFGLMAAAQLLAAAMLLSLGFCGYGFALWRNYSDALARKTFRFSLIHLSVLFAALLVDHYVL